MAIFQEVANPGPGPVAVSSISGEKYSPKRRKAMWDFSSLAIVLIFFILSWAYVAGAEKL